MAEVAIADLRLNGSLVVDADCIYGRSQSATGTFGATPAGPPQLAGQSIMLALLLELESTHKARLS